MYAAPLKVQICKASEAPCLIIEIRFYIMFNYLLGDISALFHHILCPFSLLVSDHLWLFTNLSLVAPNLSHKKADLLSLSMFLLALKVLYAFFYHLINSASLHDAFQLNLTSPKICILTADLLFPTFYYAILSWNLQGYDFIRFYFDLCKLGYLLSCWF